MEYEDFSDKLFDLSIDPFKKDRLKSHFAALLAVAKIDTDLNRPEIDFLNSLAWEMDLSDEEILDVIESPPPTLPPLSIKEKIKNLVELAIMISMNGFIDRKDLQICHRIAESYGLKETNMNVIALLVQHYLKVNRISKEDYIEVVEILYLELNNSFFKT